MKRCLKCEYVFDAVSWHCPACSHCPDRLGGVLAHAADVANGGGGFKPEYFAGLATLEAGNFWFRARNELIVWALRTYGPMLRSFLEVGCGTGFVLSGIAQDRPGLALSGSEIFVAGLSHARERVPSAQFMQMDARHLPFVDEFDALGAFDVLEHIEEDDAVLAQFCRTLRPGGLLLVTVPQHAWLWSAADEYACHVRRYGRREIEAKVTAAGFELLRSTSFISALLPAMVLSREFQKRNKSGFKPESELNINPVLNRMFYALTMVELAGIKCGMNYRAGGSRLIVARKVSN